MKKDAKSRKPDGGNRSKKASWVKESEKRPRELEKVIVMTDSGFVTTQFYLPCAVWMYAGEMVLYWMRIPPIDGMEGINPSGWTTRAVANGEAKNAQRGAGFQ